MSRPASKNDVSQRHKDEWKKFREVQLASLLSNPDADAAKIAKAIADVLKVYQEGERKAWDFNEEQTTDNSITFAWED